MLATSGDQALTFRGSISRRFTVLFASLLILVAVVAGVSIYKSHRVVRLHTEIGGLGAHIGALDRFQAAIFRLRAESRDVLFLGEGFKDPGLTEIPRRLRDQWMRFEQLHSRNGKAWEIGPPLERELHRELDQRLERFIAVARSIAEERPEAARLREAAFMLDAEANGLEDGLARLSVLHRDLMADRSLAAAADLNFILWANVACVALLGLSVTFGSVFLVRRVALPLRRLNAAALEAADGNFSREVPVISRDEIGELAHTFNRMATALAEHDGQLRRRAEEMEALYRIGADISSMLNLSDLLQTIVQSARAMLQSDVASLCLLREGGPHLDVVATAGPWEVVMGSRPAISAEGPPTDWEKVCLGCHEARSGTGVAHLSARLRLADKPLGALCVASTTRRAFGEAERDLLGGLAAQAAIAIGNARLYEQVRGMAVVEERERLAREMHDGLAQTLIGISFKLAHTQRMLGAGEKEAIRQALAEMRRVTAGAYEEVRQAVFGLRTMVSRGLGLLPTLSEYLHEFSQQAGIPVRLVASEEDGQIRVAPEVEVQLIRIVQEALNNVRKHAGARSVQVRLWQEADEALAAVEDDGVGFDPALAPAEAHRHYGLTGMRERAESVGGTLTIRSAPGTGTQVVLRVRRAATQRERAG